jgi:uncharacterized protein involved in outer membrane biogenesis
MKKVVIIGGALIIIVIILIVMGLSNLGPIIKDAVNKYGPQITKTEVTLKDVGISIFSAEATLKDFRLGNPKGFKSPHAVSVGKVHVDVDEMSLTGDTIIINKIEVVAPEIIYEKSLKTDNFKSLLNNVHSSASKEKSAEKKSGGDSSGKKIMIRDFLMRDAKLSLAVTMADVRSVDAEIPDIHLKDLGKKEGGISPAEAFELVLTALYKTVTSPGISNALKESIKKMGADIKGAGEDVEKQVKAAAEDVKTSGDDAKKQAEDAEKQLKTDLDALKGTGKGLLGN